MVQQKIYVAQNYHHITLGSVNRVVPVHSEPDGEGGLLFYIIGNEENYKFCEKHGLLKREMAGRGPVAAGKEDGDSGVARDNSEYLRTGKIPGKYFCKDHEDAHQKGEPEYYSCLDKFQSGVWSSDVELPAQSEEEGIEESPEEDEENPPAPEINTITHSMSAKEAIALIEETDDAAELNMLKDGEGQHPEYKGGRKGILTAIHKRIRSLTE